MHALATVFAIIGAVTVALVIIIGMGAWLLIGLRPGDVP